MKDVREQRCHCWSESVCCATKPIGQGIGLKRLAPVRPLTRPRRSNRDAGDLSRKGRGEVAVGASYDSGAASGGEVAYLFTSPLAGEVEKA